MMVEASFDDVQDMLERCTGMLQRSPEMLEPCSGHLSMIFGRCLNDVREMLQLCPEMLEPCPDILQRAPEMLERCPGLPALGERVSPHFSPS
jgi:hypothetical protein